MKELILIVLSIFLFITPYAEANEFGLFGQPLATPTTAPSDGGGSGGGGGGSSGGGGGSTTGGGSGSGVAADINGSGRVDIFDLSILLSNWTI